MKEEIETEIEVPDLSCIERELKGSGATLEETSQYHDIYFDPERFYSNKRMRLRKKTISHPRKGTQCIYTEKSPAFRDGIQESDEREENVDFQKTYDALKQKGIVCEFKLNVKRYRLGTCTIELREIVGFLNYVEIEGPSKEEIESALERLKIDGTTLKEGALNRLLEMKGKKKISV